MADYVKRGPKTFGGAGRKPAFGARPGKPSFAKKTWGNSRDSDGPVTLFKASCSKCGDSCEVPFKPINGKPVFCRNCFVKTGDTAGGRAGDRYPKREYSPRSYDRTSERARPETPKESNDVVVQQLVAMNAKLERLIQAVEGSRK